MEYIAFEHQKRFYIAFSRELLLDMDYLFNIDVMGIYVNDKQLTNYWGYQPVREKKNELSEFIQDKLKPLGEDYGIDKLCDREDYENGIKAAEFAVIVAETFVRPFDASKEFKLYEN